MAKCAKAAVRSRCVVRRIRLNEIRSGVHPRRCSVRVARDLSEHPQTLHHRFGVVLLAGGPQFDDGCPTLASHVPIPSSRHPGRGSRGNNDGSADWTSSARSSDGRQDLQRQSARNQSPRSDGPHRSGRCRPRGRVPQYRAAVERRSYCLLPDLGLAQDPRRPPERQCSNAFRHPTESRSEPVDLKSRVAAPGGRTFPRIAVSPRARPARQRRSRRYVCVHGSWSGGFGEAARTGVVVGSVSPGRCPADAGCSDAGRGGPHTSISSPMSPTRRGTGLIAVRANGRKELVAFTDGYRESTESWADLLRDCKSRGMRPPVVAMGDGASGFWAALQEVFRRPGSSDVGFTRWRMCWRRCRSRRKAPGSRAAGLAMAFELIEAAQTRWRTVNAPHLVRS
jgi:Transposase, Mutator family